MIGHWGPHFSIELSQVLHFQEPRGYLTGFSPAQVCGFISQIPTIRHKHLKTFLVEKAVTCLLLHLS